jgi:hypothetical protein
LVRKRFLDLRIIAISGEFGEKYLNIAKKLGAHEIVRKPFSASELVDIAERLLSVRPCA